jgi:hypothetical protein
LSDSITQSVFGSGHGRAARELGLTTTTLVLLSRIDTSKFADDDIDTNDESKRSGGKLRLSKITEENNGDIGKGWAKEKVLRTSHYTHYCTILY